MYFTGSTLSSTLIVAVFALAINNIHGKCPRYCSNPPIIVQKITENWTLNLKKFKTQQKHFITIPTLF